MLDGKRVILRKINDSDTPDILRWRNDAEATKFLCSHTGLSAGEHAKWLSSLVSNDTRIDFTIISKEMHQPIGTINLSSIDYKNQKAEYGILIGEKSQWGKGYAHEASDLILNYAFNDMNLKRIYLKVLEDNIGAVKLYKKIGFVEEGLLRNDVYKNGKFNHVMVMSVIFDEWVPLYE